MSTPSLWSFVADASFMVKLVMLLLLATSVVSWTMIFQRWQFLKTAKQAMQEFEQQFWSGIDLNNLYKKLLKRENNLHGLENIFYAGFKEYTRLIRQSKVNVDSVMESTDRAMRVVLAKEMELLEQHLAFLATVGSTSPYIGLFGTVWGIMTSFRALAGVQQASIAMVAPGISEALIATAMGLFAAIPAVIAYNKYANEAERMANAYSTFKEELASILYRQTNTD